VWPERLLQLDDAGEEAGLGQREEGVDPRELGILEAHLPLLVERAPHLGRERPQTVEGAAHVAEAIHLQQVAVRAIHREPAHDEVVIVVQQPHLARVAALGDQLRQRHVERELLDATHVVDGQRVVHVEANQVHVAHPQVAVDEDLPRPLHLPVLAWRAEHLGQGRIAEQCLGALHRCTGARLTERGAEAAMEGARGESPGDGAGRR
jgi:hypothetical protein